MYSYKIHYSEIKCCGRILGSRVQVATEKRRCLIVRTYIICRRVYSLPKHRAIISTRMKWAGHVRPRLKWEYNITAELEKTRRVFRLAQNRAQMVTYVNTITTSGSVRF
jgi:hypothetical protein